MAPNGFDYLPDCFDGDLGFGNLDRMEALCRDDLLAVFRQ
jgi:hypothetical protein